MARYSAREWCLLCKTKEKTGKNKCQERTKREKDEREEKKSDEELILEQGEIILEQGESS